MIDLSIIIVNHNNEKFLKDCLSSVFDQTKKHEFEVILVDNNSSDNSVGLVSKTFPKARIIRNKENLGFCKANNIGLKTYQGRYALLLNTDTIVKDGALDKLVEFMDANPQVGACGPKLLNPDGTPQHQGGLFNRRFWLSKNPTRVDYVIGACLLVRKEAIDKVGGLDENFFFSNDDLDWCRRIRKAGWDVCFLPQAEVLHYGGFTIKRFKLKLFVEGFRGGLYFCKKHYGVIAFYIYRILLILSMLIMIPLSALFYPLLRNKQKLLAYAQILIIAVKGEIYPNYGKT
jgi:GT2 family glycosyltransferase